MPWTVLVMLMMLAQLQPPAWTTLGFILPPSHTPLPPLCLPWDQVRAGQRQKLHHCYFPALEQELGVRSGGFPHQQKGLGSDSGGAHGGEVLPEFQSHMELDCSLVLGIRPEPSSERG